MLVERKDWGHQITDDQTGKRYSVLDHGTVYVSSDLMTQRRKLAKLPAAAQKAFDTYNNAQAQLMVARSYVRGVLDATKR